MGLISVKPEVTRPTPRGHLHSRSRMAMNDDETLARLAGGHAFRKSTGPPIAQVRGPAQTNVTSNWKMPS